MTDTVEAMLDTLEHKLQNMVAEFRERSQAANATRDQQLELRSAANQLNLTASDAMEDIRDKLDVFVKMERE